jgi:hypothetical protein
MEMIPDASPVTALANRNCEKSLTSTGAYEVRKKIQDFYSESFCITPWHVACSRYRSFPGWRRIMQTLGDNSKTIQIDNQNLPAAKCEECGAKIYPRSFLQPHLTRHQRRQRWFMKELKKLQYTIAHMRDSA